MANEKNWNPKYLEYVKATGAESPEAALARDRAANPGASMMEFILWSNRRAVEGK